MLFTITDLSKSQIKDIQDIRSTVSGVEIFVTEMNNEYLLQIHSDWPDLYERLNHFLENNRFEYSISELAYN